MVASERLEAAVVPEIGSAVADMRYAGDVVSNPRADDRGSHLCLMGILLRLVVDNLIRPAHGFGQTAGLGQIALLFGQSRRRWFLCSPVQLFQNRVYGHLAG